MGAFGPGTACASCGGALRLPHALIAAGWIPATAVIAGVTHVIRRDLWGSQNGALVAGLRVRQR